MPSLLPQLKRRVTLRLLDLLLALRALLFLGRRYTCPCCGWRVRAFTAGGATLKTRELSYCPRCNSKARHRRIWLFLRQRTNLFTEPVHLLHVSPKYALSRRFVRMRGLDYVGADLNDRPNIHVRMDLTATPFRSAQFDAVICVHVMEEIVDDGAAMREIHRVLAPGGWALVSVPTRMDDETYEDWTIVDPKERQRAFGEKAHVRVYGYDLVHRLEDAGFKVDVDWAEDVDQQTRDRYGLRDDENIFLCTKH